ncbi:hypothetical protein VQ056_29870 [Paenibacillus sp. JTLBN-2024]
MLIPKKGQRADAEGEVTFHKGLASGIAFVIGSVSGALEGAGGEVFISEVPVMLSILKFPVRMTIRVITSRLRFFSL